VRDIIDSVMTSSGALAERHQSEAGRTDIATNSIAGYIDVMKHEKKGRGDDMQDEVEGLHSRRLFRVVEQHDCIGVAAGRSGARMTISPHPGR